MHSKSMFTEKELSILRALWGTKEPLSRLKILELMGEELNPTSFHFAMNSLIERGYVVVAGFERSGTNYGRTYKAAKTRGDFVVDLVSSTQPIGAAQNDVAEVVMAFVQKGGITEEAIAELEAMLAERRRELELEKAQEGNTSRKE